MVNIGIDFGSTYTTVSVYNRKNDALKTLHPGHSTFYIPSIVSMYKNHYEWGQTAKSMTSQKDVKTYRAFKMLLSEQDELTLFQRGYNTQDTPEHMTRFFLKSLLKSVLHELHEDRINCLVIGIPEIWNEKIATLETRAVLRNICNSFDFINSVKVVSEPMAGAAFLAHNYFKKTGTNFDGNILLVDFGGGTLDIALTKIMAGDDSKNVEIKVLEHCGAGENEHGRPGQAGIAYMEKVVEQAIEEAGIRPGFDSAFTNAVNALEKAMQTKTHTMAHMFEEYGIYDVEGLDEEVFTVLRYKAKDIPVSYGLLVRVYEQVISGVLDAQLDKMIEYMGAHGIRYMDRDCEDFKIAVIGGFSNFYLVKKQIEKKFKISAYDQRLKDILFDKDDCKPACSGGAALLAEGILGICNVAPYAIGIWAYDIDRKVCLNYAINYRQEVDADKVYYARGGVDDEIFVVQAISGNIDRFLVNFSTDDRTACFAYAKDAFAKKLENVIQNQYKTAVVGFSVDASGIVSIHVRDYDILEGKISEKDNVIELTRFGDLFEVTGAPAINKGSW